MKKLDKTTANTLASMSYIQSNIRCTARSILSDVISDIGIHKTKSLLFDLLDHPDINNDNLLFIKSVLEEIENDLHSN